MSTYIISKLLLWSPHLYTLRRWRGVLVIRWWIGVRYCSDTGGSICQGITQEIYLDHGCITVWYEVQKKRVHCRPWIANATLRRFHWPQARDCNAHKGISLFPLFHSLCQYYLVCAHVRKCARSFIELVYVGT